LAVASIAAFRSMCENLIDGLMEEGFRASVVRAPRICRRLPRNFFHMIAVIVEQTLLPLIGLLIRANLTLYPYNFSRHSRSFHAARPARRTRPGEGERRSIAVQALLADFHDIRIDAPAPDPDVWSGRAVQEISRKWW
jgi:hypothetical protein